MGNGSALEDRAEIAAVLATLRAIPGDSGDEYRKKRYFAVSRDLSHHFESLPAPYVVHQAEDGRS